MSSSVHLLLCTFIMLCTGLSAQYSSNAIIVSGQDELTVESLLEKIESETGLTFSYNSQFIKDLPPYRPPSTSLFLSDLLEDMASHYQIHFEYDPGENKFLILRRPTRIITGMVRDSLSGEGLPQVLITYSDNLLAYTNKDGFFSLSAGLTVDSITFSYIGFLPRTLAADEIIYRNDYVVYLSNRNVLSNVLITSSEKEFNDILPERNISREHIEKSQGITGNNDVFSYLRMLPGVSVGSEGQNGLIVRGGGPDQNQILIDGIQIYEASHLGGLSSIFISDAIRSVDFYKAGIPAHLNGKLSSVVDVHLKDGHRHAFRRSVAVGLEGAEGHIEGPLGPNTSINLNGKFSWFSTLAAPLLEDNLAFNNTTLRYNDGYSKVSHWFGPSNRISFSAYSGSDLIRLSRNENQTQSLNFTDVNRIDWSNRLFALNWSLALSDKLYLSTILGSSSFNYTSRGSYSIDYPENDTILNNSFDILSHSDLTDLSLKSIADYYSSDKGKFSFGIEAIRHRNAPSIIESEHFLDPDLLPAAEMDSTYYSHELALFGEHEFLGVDGWLFRTGLRMNYFGGLDTRYFFLLPRLSVHYETSGFTMGGSWTRMSQFIHLLINPGPGLPSDLWVPSTEKIEPEISDIFSVQFRSRKGPMIAGVDIFYKSYRNVIEYSNVSDILYSLIIDDELFNVSVNNSNWEERVSTGSGKSYGIEFFAGWQLPSLEWNMAYTLSRSTRQFDDLNNGEAFPYKYDRRHNLSTAFKYKISDNKSIQVNFAYGTGNAFTLATEQIKGVDCQPRLVPISRNNARVPDYHHLDFLYSQVRVLDGGGELSFDIGIYNIYNRLNPFYVYLFQDPETQTFDGFRKISIYPVIPKFNLKYSW